MANNLLGLVKTGEAVAADERGQVVQTVRKDAPAALADQDGDAAPPQSDELGYLRVALRGLLLNSEYHAPVRDDRVRRLLEELITEVRGLRADLAAR